VGRRTVENPDLHHRAHRQGVARHVAELEEHGFTVLERVISDGFADEIRPASLDVLADHGVSSLNWMLYQGRPFERLAQHPKLLTLVDASLGRGAVIGSLPKGSVVFFTEGLWHWQGDRTEPGDRVTLHWHVDRGIFPGASSRRSSTRRCCTATRRASARCSAPTTGSTR
jgi:hypothetical protein